MSTVLGPDQRVAFSTSRTRVFHRKAHRNQTALVDTYSSRGREEE